MPNLPDQNIKFVTEDGVAFSYSATVTVDAEGVFRVSIDDRLSETARKLFQQEQNHSNQWCLVHSNRKWRVEARTLRQAVAAAELVCQTHLQCEKSTIRVIAYRVDLKLSFAIDELGRLSPNCGKSFGGDNSSWWNPTNQQSALHAANRAKSFSVGLFAKVYDKTTYKRSTGETYTWELVDMEDPDGKLNAFVGIDDDPQIAGTQELPYTREAAEYFNELLLGLCGMGKRLDDFFADQSRLRQAIADRKPLQLAP